MVLTTEQIKELRKEKVIEATEFEKKENRSKLDRIYHDRVVTEICLLNRILEI